MQHAWRYAPLLSALLAVPVLAGEIPGLPSQLPPTTERDFEVSFVNDFIGRGGSVDDFRTQQLIIMARLSGNWIALLDHSILTLGGPPITGRIDQLSASLGYRLFDYSDDRSISRLTLGGGLRSAADFAGERIQNGFHRLIGSDIEFHPYTGTEETDMTVWVDAEHHAILRGAMDNGWVGKWDTGYWLRGNSLVTTGGAFDASASAFAVASRNAIDVWFGLRQDWRSGYEDPVLRATANAEEDLSVVLGVRFGALVIETVQQTNNDASYGQLRLVSSGYRSMPISDEQPRMGIDFGFLLPDVQLQLAGRFKSRFSGAGWQRALMFDLGYGEPQKDDDPTLFVRTVQLTAGMDWERPVFEKTGWISYFANVGAGWRSEQLVNDSLLGNTTSDAANRAVVTIATGLRIDAARLGSRWRYRITTGLRATIPLNDAERQLGVDIVRIQEPIIAINIGMSFDYD